MDILLYPPVCRELDTLVSEQDSPTQVFIRHSPTLALVVSVWYTIHDAVAKPTICSISPITITTKAIFVQMEVDPHIFACFCRLVYSVEYALVCVCVVFFLVDFFVFTFFSLNVYVP